MLLRKRVWDIMREEYASVDEDASLAEAVQAMHDLRARQPDANFILVFSRDGRFLGILSMWNLIQGMGPCLLKEPEPEDREVDWDKAFGTACRGCAQMRINEWVQTDVPVLKANDPLARGLEVLLDYRRGRAVVEEGGRIIGVVTVADLFREISRALA